MPRHISRDSRDSLRNALVLETDAIDRLLKKSRERMLSSERLIDIWQGADCPKGTHHRSFNSAPLSDLPLAVDDWSASGSAAAPRKTEEDNHTMTKSKKSSGPAQVSSEISGPDRTALTHAYKAGLILAWKRDIEHGYRLTLAGRADEYVQSDQLTKYLESLRP